MTCVGASAGAFDEFEPRAQRHHAWEPTGKTESKIPLRNYKVTNSGGVGGWVGRAERRSLVPNMAPEITNQPTGEGWVRGSRGVAAFFELN